MRRWAACALVLAACGSQGAPTSGSSSTIAPPCGPGSAPDAVLLAFGAYGTHGQQFSESLTVRCSGEAVLDAPAPWTVELRGRPGRYTLPLDPPTLARLRDLAVRLAAPVGMPSVPPQGVDVSITTGTVPPVSRPLRPGDGEADGEAAAVLTELTRRVIASLPATE
jgi:hypothetical protein